MISPSISNSSAEAYTMGKFSKGIEGHKIGMSEFVDNLQILMNQLGGAAAAQFIQLWPMKMVRI